MTSTNFSVDIAGLAPRHAALMQGGVYAVVEEDERCANALLFQSLLSAQARGKPAFLATPGDLKTMLANHGALGSVFRDAVRRDAISVFQHAGVKNAGAMAFADRLFADLIHFDSSEHAMVVLDGAEGLFSDSVPDDILLLRRLRDWTEQTGSVLLLVLRPAANRAGTALARLFPCSRLLSGLARIRNHYGQVAWEVFHWFGTGGVAGAESFDLILNPNGTLTAAPPKPAEAPAQLAGREAPAVDDRVVYAMRQVLQKNETPPASWQVLADPQALDQATASAVAATVVLVFSGSAAFDPLARCIHGLRARCGPRLKIVVRELNLRLRYSQEALLLRLGANLIVPAEVGFARFLGLAGMVQGQVYAHPIVPSYEAAVADATPEKEQGYLPPAAFIQAVAAMLDASRALNMQEVLVRMPLGYGLQPLDALRYCAIKRAGDLCTADDQSVYLFLHACREGDVDMTLERLFKLPVAEFFSSESRYFSPDQIQHAIDELQQRCHHGAYPDLSTELARASLQPQPAIAGPALQAENAAAPARGAPTAVRYAAPPAAERRPLKMRGAPTLVEIGSLNK